MNTIRQLWVGATFLATAALGLCACSPSNPASTPAVNAPASGSSMGRDTSAPNSTPASASTDTSTASPSGASGPVSDTPWKDVQRVNGTGYSLEVPTTWAKKSNPENPELLYASNEPLNGYRSQVQVMIADAGGATDPAQQMDVLRKNLTALGAKNIQPVNVGSLDAAPTVSLSYEGPVGVRGIQTSAIKNGKLYHLTYTENDQTAAQAMQDNMKKAASSWKWA